MPLRHRWLFSRKWDYEGNDRSFRGYLRSAKRRSGFWPYLAATVVFAAAGFASLRWERALPIYLGVMCGLLAVGYVVWRRQG